MQQKIYIYNKQTTKQNKNKQKQKTKQKGGMYGKF